MRPPDDAATGERLSFLSGGKQIGMVAYRSSAPAAPSIVVLHGAGGVESGNRYIDRLARTVAAHGCHTFIVEYFDRTGTIYATEPIIRAHFEPWLETISDAVTFLVEEQGAAAKRIGTFGYSLGGYLVVTHASRDDRIGAVVELAGGIDAGMAAAVTRLPPVLIVHGRNDQRVPFGRALELEKFMRQMGFPVETEFLSNEGHVLSPMAAIAALQRALAFLKTHLPWDAAP